MEPPTVPERRERAAAGRLLPRKDLAGTIYGIIFVSALLVTYEESVDTPLEAVPLVLLTTFVFALAHAWANTLSESGRAPLARRFMSRLAHEWPLVQAALPASIVLVLTSPHGTWTTGSGWPSSSTWCCCSSGARCSVTSRTGRGAKCSRPGRSARRSASPS